jgi:hypothetical protein
MKMTETPDSSNIYAVGYDPDRQVMHVQFCAKDKRMPGKTYSYVNVSAEQHAEMIAAPSVGSHFSEHIKAKPHLHPCSVV